MARDVELGELISRGLESRAADIWTAAPGRVESYDPTTRTADVRALTTRPIANVDTDEMTHEELPILPSVPVCFPGAGGGILLSWPIAVGTTGLLVFLTRSDAAWRTGAANGATPRDPGDLRLHHPGNAKFFPGLIPDTASTPATAVNALVVAAPEVRLGDHTATDFVALSSLVRALVGDLANAILTATPTAGDGGAGLQVSALAKLVIAGWTGTTPPPSATAATKVKAR